MLFALGGLYGVSGLAAGDPFALTAPIAPPDFTEGGPADLPACAAPINCCLSVTKKIVDFKLLPKTDPMQIRPAAHLASKEYLVKYKKVVELMVQSLSIGHRLRRSRDVSIVVY